jgi:hypothetical protein
VPVLGAAGLSLSLASGASAAIAAPTAHALTRAPVNHEISLGEEDISGVSLATFYVADKENVAPSQPRIRLAGGGCGCAGCAGCGGCGGCWTGTYYSSSVIGGPAPAYDTAAPYYEPGYGPRHSHRHKHAAKRTHPPKKS